MIGNILPHIKILLNMLYFGLFNDSLRFSKIWVRNDSQLQTLYFNRIGAIKPLWHSLLNPSMHSLPAFCSKIMHGWISRESSILPFLMLLRWYICNLGSIYTQIQSKIFNVKAYRDEILTQTNPFLFWNKTASFALSALYCVYIFTNL